MNLSIFNSLCYTLGWFWCVICGVHGYSILAALGALCLIILQLYYTKINDLALYIQDLLLVIFSVPLGVLLEIFFIQTALIHYTNSSTTIPPLWIVFIYPLFSLLINHSLKIVQKNYSIPLLLGLLGAPLSYIGGESMGGLTFGYPLLPTWIVLGTSWGLFLCLLSKIGRVVKKAALETLEDRDSTHRLELLFDGECPLCNKEISLLQKKGANSKLIFVDIASKNFNPINHQNIDYHTAMSQIHALNENGTILIGLSAFAAIYARCGLLVTSTCLRIPFILFLLKPLYTLFAKKRLWITGRSTHCCKKQDPKL